MRKFSQNISAALYSAHIHIYIYIYIYKQSLITLHLTDMNLRCDVAFHVPFPSKYHDMTITIYTEETPNSPFDKFGLHPAKSTPSIVFAYRANLNQFLNIYFGVM